MTAPRYEVAPLLAHIAKHWPDAVRSPGGIVGWTLGAMPPRTPEVLCGVGRASWSRYVAAGSLSTTEADRVACGLAVHPATIWPTWWDDAANEPACSWCGSYVDFGHPRSGCSRTCRRRLAEEQARDAERIERFRTRLDAIRERVWAMTPAELAAWLGIEDDEMVEAA